MAVLLKFLCVCVCVWERERETETETETERETVPLWQNVESDLLWISEEHAKQDSDAHGPAK